MTSQVTGAGEELNRKKLFMKMKFHVESFSSLLNKKKKKKEKKELIFRTLPEIAEDIAETLSLPDSSMFCFPLA